jgi:hypothetical protein
MAVAFDLKDLVGTAVGSREGMAESSVCSTYSKLGLDALDIATI